MDKFNKEADECVILRVVTCAKFALPSINDDVRNTTWNPIISTFRTMICNISKDDILGWSRLLWLNVTVLAIFYDFFASKCFKQSQISLWCRGARTFSTSSLESTLNFLSTLTEALFSISEVSCRKIALKNAYFWEIEFWNSWLCDVIITSLKWRKPIFKSIIRKFYLSSFQCWVDDLCIFYGSQNKKI